MDIREQLALATEHLDADDLAVWIAKHAHGYGRRAGALALNLTEEQFRYRLARADRTMKTILDQHQKTT